MKDIVRVGDRTDHGGTVIEGFGTTTSGGKPWAGVGHKVVCPRCKGAFPIIEGHAHITVDGIPVAMHGMRTACGATLLATPSTTMGQHPLPGAAAGVATAFLNSAGSTTALPSSSLHDDLYVLRDAGTDEPIANADYAIRRANGELEYGRTNSRGQTHLLSAVAKSEPIEIFVEGQR